MTVPARATYRVQLREEFGFDDATALVPYLATLGISHLYCSPYMQAARGSAHGYDVVDPARVSDDLGGDAGLQRLAGALRDARMTQLLDIVPNHMCVTDPRNRYWWDVLLHGRESAHAAMFDIDWDAPAVDGRVVLPFLGDELDAVLERGELTVERGEGGAELAYYEQRFPLRDGSAPRDVVTRDVLDAQHYSLEYWRTGLGRINYRRFFDVSSLAGVRQEDETVFGLTHERVLQLVGGGVVEGLRIDHVDGLRDPEQYLRRLRSAAPDAWILVEKILSTGELLPDAWPVDGTTGYDFTALVTALHVDALGREAITECYREFVEDDTPFAQQARAARRLVLHELLQSEVDRLARAAAACGIAEAEPALVELLAAMPVYRVYPDDAQPLSPADNDALDEALRLAHEAGHADAAAIDGIARVLRGGGDGAACADLRARFQQVSAAAMAKGVEDTAFYRYVPLVALNEVGAEPEHAVGVREFHDACIERARTRPSTLLATATHDTKRGEDARLRVAMLSAMPERWCEAVRRLRVRAGAHRGTLAPSRVTEYLLYETLVAAHPLTPDRASQYMLKAVREAKQETNWLSPNEEYEAQLDTFVRGVLDDPVMIEEIEALLDAMTPAWQIASLSQTLLKLTAPGVPDMYQGCELWDLRLVDPDNRTPVDYELRRDMLHRLDTLSVEQVMAEMDAGLPKLHLLRTALQLRARRPGAFSGAYTPLDSDGVHAQHVVAFARGEGDDRVVTVAARAPVRVAGGWGDTRVVLPDGAWRNALTGDAVDGGARSVAELTSRFPVALLERADG